MKHNVGNLKYNWYLPISAMALFCLNGVFLFGYLLGIPIAIAAVIVLAAKIPPLPDTVRETRRGISAFSFLTALGICLFSASSFFKRFSSSPRLYYFEVLFQNGQTVLLFLSISMGLLAICFVYYCTLIFCKKMSGIFSTVGIFRSISTWEAAVYGILIICTLCFMVFSFLQTNAFYGAAQKLDVIYTSDSSVLVLDNTYLNLNHVENNLRQPLFAVFSAPFIGIPYLLGVLLGNDTAVKAILMNAVQIVVLFAAHFMLAKMLRLTPGKRICFLLLTSCTYTHLLFCLMMEQYIFTYFWLIFCLYLICEAEKPQRFALWGAGSTLLTSMILLPFLSNKHPLKDFKGWFGDCVRLGLEFIALILAFCRFDIFYYLPSHITELMSFSGVELTFFQKFCQYLSFISGCFIAPDAGINTTAVEHISWQLHPVTGISVVGTSIFILAIISAIVNRDKKSSRFAIGWVAFSVVLLLIFGWGTKENGLILYALYFGWAFFVLLFQLVAWIEEKCRIHFLIPFVSIGCAVLLLAANIPAVLELLRFAVTYYPA